MKRLLDWLRAWWLRPRAPDALNLTHRDGHTTCACDRCVDALLAEGRRLLRALELISATGVRPVISRAEWQAVEQRWRRELVAKLQVVDLAQAILKESRHDDTENR
jgi:hypothetical protein